MRPLTPLLASWLGLLKQGCYRRWRGGLPTWAGVGYARGELHWVPTSRFPTQLNNQQTKPSKRSQKQGLGAPLSVERSRSTCEAPGSTVHHQHQKKRKKEREREEEEALAVACPCSRPPSRGFTPVRTASWRGASIARTAWCCDLGVPHRGQVSPLSRRQAALMSKVLVNY